MTTTLDKELAPLSPYNVSSIEWDGATYPSIVNAVEASKFEDKRKRKIFTLCDPHSAFKMGAVSQNTQKQAELFASLYRTEVAKHSDLLSLLGDEDINFINTHHDNFYGICTCDLCGHTKKHNYAGAVLKEMRDGLHT